MMGLEHLSTRRSGTDVGLSSFFSNFPCLYFYAITPPQRKEGSILLLVGLILFSCLACHSSGVPVRFTSRSAVLCAYIGLCLSTSTTSMCPTCSLTHISLFFWQSACSLPYVKLSVYTISLLHNTYMLFLYFRCFSMLILGVKAR